MEDLEEEEISETIGEKTTCKKSTKRKKSLNTEEQSEEKQKAEERRKQKDKTKGSVMPWTIGEQQAGYSEERHGQFWDEEFNPELLSMEEQIVWYSGFAQRECQYDGFDWLPDKAEVDRAIHHIPAKFTKMLDMVR